MKKKILLKSKAVSIRLLALILICAMIFNFNLNHIIVYASGDLPNANGASGTQAKPYIVNEPSDFSWIVANGRSGYIIQTADVDLSGFTWVPIGANNGTPFTGTYDGNGYKISNMSLNDGNLSYMGMFGYATNATIRNVSLYNVNFTGGQVENQVAIGAIAGMSAGTTVVERCHVLGTSSITGFTNDTIGGVVGSNGGSLNYCSSTATISAGNFDTGSKPSLGGISGSNWGSITNSFNRGSVSCGTGSSAGGIVGFGYSNLLTNCYSTGTVTVGAGSEGGAIIGNITSAASVSGNYYLTGVSANGIGKLESIPGPSNTGTTSTSSANMKLQGTYSGWNFAGNIWTFQAGINDDYPVLKSTPVLAVTGNATESTITTITVDGNVTSAGIGTITERGIEYALNSATNLVKIPDSSSATGTFSIVVTGLVPNTSYYVRSYAVNESGTSYGEPIIITTKPLAPALTLNVLQGGAIGSTKAVISDLPTNRFVINITDATVGYVVAGDTAPSAGANYVNNYVSGNDISNGVFIGKFMQIYDVNNLNQVVKFKEIQLNISHIKGTDLSLPFNDGFENGGSIPDAWGQTVVNNMGANLIWSVVTASTEDTVSASPLTGAYMAKAEFYSADSGATSRFNLIRNFSLPAGSSYEFSFNMYHSNVTDFGINDAIQPQISLDSGSNWTNLGGELKRINGSNGWTKYTLSLDAYAGESSVRIGLLGTSDYGYSVLIDDVEIKSLSLAAKALTADSTANSVDGDLEITFGADAPFESAITGVSYNGNNLTANQYTVSSGKVTLHPSANDNTYLRTPATGNVILTATGYINSSISQTINAGAVTSLEVTTQPVPGASNGAVFTTQPVVKLKDQYNNYCTTGISTTANVVATAKAGTGSWTIGGTTTRAAASGTATFIDLTSALTLVGNGSVTFTSGVITVDSTTFTIPKNAAKALTADTTANSVDSDLEITFGADGGFESAITGVSYNGNNLTANQYTVSSGKVTLHPSANDNTYLRTPSTATVILTATGFVNSSVSQTINAGAVTSLEVTTQPVPGASNGAVFTTQPVVKLKDQYNNYCTTGISTTANVVATAKAGTGSWTIGGTTTRAAGSGTATFIDLTSALTLVGNGSVTFTSGVITVDSTTFTIPKNAAKTLTADTTANSVDSDLEITFGADGGFESAITGVSYNGNNLTANQYTVSSGKVTLHPSANDNTYLRTPATANVILTATGYVNSSISQTINAGAVTSLEVTTQPVPGASNGAVFATQPVVKLKDQYNNYCTTGISTTANVVATAKAGTGSWTIGGTTTRAAASGTATFIDLTSALTLVGNGSVTFASGVITVDSTTFTIPKNAAKALTADTAANSVDSDLEITFGADGGFESAITGVSYNGNNLTANQYTVSSGKVTLHPSANDNTYLRTPATANVILTATGYGNSSVSQTINAGAVTSLEVTTQPVAGASNGAVFAMQPVVKLKDQYNNYCTTGISVTANVVATAKAGTGSWTIGGTTTRAAASGTATFIDLTSTLTLAGNGSMTFTSGVITQDSTTFTIPKNAAKALTADTAANSVDSDLEITFGADGGFESAIIGVSYNGNNLTANQYTVSSGKVTLHPSANDNTYLRTPATANVILTATGYVNSIVSQTINAGAVTSLEVTTQPVPGASNGAVFAMQPVVKLKDQYNNDCTTGISVTANVVATAKAGTGSWTIGGTTIRAAASGTATFTDLTSTLTLAGNGSMTFTSGVITQDSTTFTIPKNAAKALTADTTANSVDRDLEITFGADGGFESAITGVSYNGNNLTANQYTVSSGKVTLHPSANDNTYLRTPATANIVLTAMGYVNSSVSQTIIAGAVTSLEVTTQPVPSASNGAVFATQPVVKLKDQYNNYCTTGISVTANVVATAKAGTGSWAIGGTTTRAAVSGTATFTDLTSTLTLAGNGSVTFASGVITVNSTTFTVLQNAAKTLTADTTANSVDRDLEITFGADATFESAITGVSYNGNNLIANQYTVSSGKVTLHPSANDNTYLRIPATGNIILTATGYVNSSVSQTIKHGTAASMTLAQNIMAASTNGGHFAQQPRVEIKDGYGNLCTSDHVTIVTASKEDAGIWILNGITTETASSGVVSFTNLGASNTEVINTAQLRFTSGMMTKVTSGVVTLLKKSAPNDAASDKTPTLPTPTPPVQEPVIVIVNGEGQNAGKETKRIEDGKSIVTIEVATIVIDSKIDEAIKNNTTGADNSIQVIINDTKSETAQVILTGDIVKKLEKNTFDISVKKDDIEYIIPAEEFTISKVAENLGVKESDLIDIQVEVNIAKLDDKLIKQYNEVAKANGAELVFPPVSFEVVAKTIRADQSTGEVQISKFSNFIERVMEIPADIVPSKITTGIVFNLDGTYSHVPTEVYQKNGKWYASLNSLTNSNYSVIWNPMTLKSVEKHWSKATVNDMASRLIISDPENFEPNKMITRANFADYIVRALGLYREGSVHENHFKDEGANRSITLAILIAREYGIINGYQDGTFRPDALITREEAMKMYQNAMKITKLVGSEADKYKSYTDFVKVSNWASNAVKEVLSAHVFNGTSEKNISPKAHLTYAEAIQAIKNLLVESKLINK